MDDDNYMRLVGTSINRNYGHDVVQHGTHIVGFYNRVAGASQDKLWEYVFIFNARGYVGEGFMRQEYERFGGRYFPPPGLGRNNK